MGRLAGAGNKSINSMKTKSFNVFAVLFTAVSLQAAPIPNESKISGLAVGSQTTSMTVFESVERIAETGGKLIELSPGQVLTADGAQGLTGRLDHNADAQTVEGVKAKLAQHGIRAASYGVVDIPNNEAAARKVFEFARKLELYTIITDSVGSLDLIETLAKEYDIFVAIAYQPKRFNAQRDAQGRSIEDTSYKLWHPEYLRDLVAKRDRHIGVSADLGHWQTSGFKAIDGLKLFEGRLITVRAKERAALGSGQSDIPLGTGITDMSAVLTELKRQKFEGPLTLGIPDDGGDPSPKLKQAVDFIRDWKPKD